MIKLQEHLCLKKNNFCYNNVNCEECKHNVKKAPKKDYCNFCIVASYTNKPFKVTTRPGREVEIQFNFCPYCGRKLFKGDV